MRIRTHCPRGSTGAMALTRGVGGLRLRREGSAYRYRPGDRIINWGCTRGLEGVPDNAYLNSPRAVRLAVHKDRTYEVLRQAGLNTPDTTLDKGEAREWLLNGHRILRRSTMTGSQGRGIVVYSPEGSEYSRPLSAFDADETEGATYVRMFANDPSTVLEFRVHANQEEVIDFTVKRKRNGTQRFDPYIRSSSNGWVFCRQAEQLPATLRAAGVGAIRALSLDFGAVDCAVRFATADARRGWTGVDDAALRQRGHGEENTDYAPVDYTIYEVNSAPGLEGTTLERYINFVRTKLGA